MKIKEFVKKHKYVLSIVFLLGCFSLFMMLFFTKESDYFWHIKAGEYMFKNNTILTKDVFSWFMNGKYWMSHEWAFDYLIYLLKYLFGDFHLFIYPFLCTSGLLFVLFFANKKNYLKNIIFMLFWIVSFLLFSVYVQARPHMISFIFLALLIYFLYDLYWNEDSKKIYFLPLITIFWTNFHGGSSNLSYLFCVIFSVVGLFNFKFTKVEAKRLSKKQIYKYLIVAALCVIAICFNPHGLRMLTYPYENIMDTLMVSCITEWQPTTLSNFNHFPYFILLVVLVLVMLFSKKEIRFIDLVLFGVSVVLGLKSIRFWAYTYILMSYVIFYYIPERRPDKGTVGMITILGCLFIGMFIFNYSISDIVDKQFISNKMISVIKKENPKRLYNMYDYGGELVYNGIEVFVDGRADLYSKYNLADYMNISELESDYVKLIDKYDFDYFLVMKKYPINTYLYYNSDYELVYSEDDVVFYKKKDSTL